MKALEKRSAPAEKGRRLVDIASLAGVSRITVQKVLFPGGANNTRVSKETAERIKSIAAELNYLPNFSARHLAGTKTRLIGVTIDATAPEISLMVLNALERCAAAKGYRLIIGRIHSDINSVGEYLTDFAGRAVEGLVSFAHDFPGHFDDLDGQYQRIKNVVFVGGPHPEWADWVGVDIAGGMRMVVRHLIATGRRRIALHMSNGDSEALLARVRGFQDEVAAAKLNQADCPICFYDCSGKNPIGSEIGDSLGKLLGSHPQTQAIVSVNDLVAMYAIKYLASRGLSTPRDVAVTGFDNLEFGSVAMPSLTSVDQMATKVAEKVMAQLLSRVADPQRAPERVLIEPVVVVRESTGIDRDESLPRHKSKSRQQTKKRKTQHEK